MVDQSLKLKCQNVNRVITIVHDAQTPWIISVSVIRPHVHDVQCS